MKEKSKVLKGLAGSLEKPETPKELTGKGDWRLEAGDWIWVPRGTDGLPDREGKPEVPVMPKMNSK